MEESMSNKQVPGYFLLEIVIYCAIATFLSWLTITQCLTRITFLSSLSSTATKSASIHLASTLFLRIVNKLPAQRSMWKKITETNVVISTAGEDIGLRIEDHKLWKITGTYNAHNEQWHRKHKSMILDNIHEGRFEITMSTKTPQHIKALVLNAKIKINNNCVYQLEQWAVPRLLELS